LIEFASVPVLLAGGIRPENVAAAIQATHPYGVDLSSGIESEVGVKDPAKVARLIAEVRSTEE
jgi:phosphoribosylanthranilate isomerase